MFYVPFMFPSCFWYPVACWGTPNLKFGIAERTRHSDNCLSPEKTSEGRGGEGEGEERRRGEEREGREGREEEEEGEEG